MNIVAGAREAAGQKLWMDWDFFISWVYIERSKKDNNHWVAVVERRKKQYAEKQL